LKILASRAAFILAGFAWLFCIPRAAPDPSMDVQSKPAPISGFAPPVAGKSQTFDERCAGPGILVCEGFDRPEDFVPARWPGSGVGPGSCSTCTVRDTAVKASGKSSFRMEIPGNSGERPAGNWVQHFGRGFGPGSTFYVQFAFRADSNWFMNWDAIVGSWPKIAIFHNWAGGTCAVEDAVLTNVRGTGVPVMYGECGGTSFNTGLDGLRPDPKNNTPYLIQQGFTDPPPTKGYACHNYDPNAGPPYTGNCFHLQPDVWYTFYWKIHVGNWGQPNSSIEGYVGTTGGQLKKFINAVRWTLNANSPPDSGFDAITLTQYMTDAKPVSHPSAYVWYDDLIISSEPIACPTAP
jgi:hypothetical protein